MNYKFKVYDRDLSPNENSILNSFLVSLLSKPHSSLVYRGESLTNLKSKLKINPNDNAIDKLNYFIFKIGEKGRVYQKDYFDNLKDKSLFSINETSERFYKYIFNKINHVLSKSKDPEIFKFKKTNETFVTYFLNKKNLNHFILQISKLDNANQLKIRDYYLIMLHRVGYLGFYLNTFMLSTTLSKEIAEDFTTEKDIMFVSWQTKRTTNLKRLDKDFNLPSYKRNLFSYQKEVTFKGGLFPQDILGFIDRDTNIFYVNPNLFNYPHLINYIIENGIPVDQTNFEEIKAMTNYTGSFYYDGNEFNDNI